MDRLINSANLHVTNTWVNFNHTFDVNFLLPNRLDCFVITTFQGSIQRLYIILGSLFQGYIVDLSGPFACDYRAHNDTTVVLKIMNLAFNSINYTRMCWIGSYFAMLLKIIPVHIIVGGCISVPQQSSTMITNIINQWWAQWCSIVIGNSLQKLQSNWIMKITSFMRFSWAHRIQRKLILTP